MKKPILRIKYLSPNMSVLPLTVEKMFVASVNERGTHEDYESTDLFE